MKPSEAVKLLLDKNRELEKRVTKLEQLVAGGDADWDIDDPDLDIEHQGEKDDGLADLDPEQRAAVLEARERLANDGGQAIAPSRYGIEPAIIETDDETIVEVPPPSESQQAQRQAFAPQLGLVHLAKDTGFDEEVLTNAWIKGGPIWLHGFNRDFVMSLPPDARRAFVNDVEEHSPTWAQELARDILKEDGPGGPEITIQSLIATATG